MPRFQGTPVEGAAAPRFAGVPAQTRTLAERYAAAGIDPDEYSPTAGMSGGDKFVAGMGRSVAETWRGLKQIGGAVADTIPGVDLSEFRRDTQAEIDEARRIDAPLMSTGWGTAGNITGNILQLVTPGAALKGTTAARALLPTTIRGNALQGAALGALQPTATGESRTRNALVGGAMGGAGAAAIKGVAAGARGTAGAVRRVLSGESVSSADRAAAERLLAEAADATRLQQGAPSQVQGATRTLAEETRDEGLARLEQTLRGQPGYNWGARDATVNAARLAELERIAGTDADMAAAIAARGQATGQLRDQAFNEADQIAAQAGAAGFSPAGNVAGLRQQFQAIAGEHGGRSAVRRTVDAVLGELDDASTSAQGLYNVRKSINDMIEGKAGSDRDFARAATAELIQMRGLVDDELQNLAPSFSNYLQSFRQMSLPINRMEMGRELVEGSTPSVLTDAAGNRALSPAAFSKRARDLDALAAKATGFAKAKADEIMSPADIATIKAIQDDLERQAFAATKGTGGNSATAARAGVLARVGRGVMGAVPGGGFVRDLAGMLNDRGTQRINERLAYLMANPNEARRVLQALPPAGRQIVSKALTALSGAGAGSAAVTAEGRDQPLEFDVTGGTIGPAPTPEEMAAFEAQMRQRAATGAY